MTSNQDDKDRNGKADFDVLLARMRDLRSDGMESARAFGVAALEQRIKQWPEGYGDDLHILIYGDFEPPMQELSFASLGITLHPKNLLEENIIVKPPALTILEASVKIEEKSIEAIVDARWRINTLLGAYVYANLGNSGCGWWSWVTHGTGGGLGGAFDVTTIDPLVQSIRGHDEKVRTKLLRTLYWIREPKRMVREFYRSDILQVFAGYWNAFECLVDAVEIVQRPKKLSPSEKRSRLEQLLSDRSGELSIGDVDQFYRDVINPGFRGEARHALEICFSGKAEHYMTECFKPNPDSLYQIRNDINHGNVDAEHPEELVRMESRLIVLWEIVWGMFRWVVTNPVAKSEGRTGG